MINRGQLTGVILAGGRATRMGGQDKGLLALGAETMAARAARLLARQTQTLIINANRNLDDYRRLGYPVVSDQVGEFFGPLAGVLAALDHVAGGYVLTAPCDSPLLADDYAERMCRGLQANDGRLAVASDGARLQPVFILLAVELRDDLRAYLHAGERKIDRWFGRHNPAVVDFSDRQAMFRNVNTPEDLQALNGELG